MVFEIYFYGKEDPLIVEAAPDTTGMTYQKEDTIVIPGKENEMRMVLIPWASIERLEYVITPDMIPQEEVAPRDMNRKARRASGLV